MQGVNLYGEAVTVRRCESNSDVELQWLTEYFNFNHSPWQTSEQTFASRKKAQDG